MLFIGNSRIRLYTGSNYPNSAGYKSKAIIIVI